MTILIEVSPGELIDKLTILEIKLDNISDPTQLSNVGHEHQLLSAVRRSNVTESAELAGLTANLKEVNLRLWKLEDDIRDHERNGDFGASFVQLARSVYRTNDARAALKRRINHLLQSAIVEEKSYSSY